MTSGEELRSIMRCHPAGVCVATVDLDGQRLGLTIGSLVSLSLHPPLVGIAVGRQRSMHELLREAGGFALSILAASQAGLAQHFARGVPPIAMWQGVETHDGARGPLLDGAVGWIECVVRAELETGDHTFFVGEVERAQEGHAGAALFRFAAEYRST